jgi:hypothetical protein
VEPCPPHPARSAADPDDLLIARLAAIAAVLDPVPAAVQENARRLYAAAFGEVMGGGFASFDEDWRGCE